tara:strand:+ start:129 stop:368 length:240 start_codon:yes stop_codon:yes gene_type:complete
MHKMIFMYYFNQFYLYKLYEDKTKKIKTIYETAVESYKDIRNSADELSLKLIELEKEYSDKIDTFLKKTKYYKLLKDIS